MVKIFVGNLATTRSNGAAGPVVTNRDLKPLFELYGTVTECVVLDDQCFGFVHMPNQRAAERAVRELNGCQVVGSRIKVQISTSNCTSNSETEEFLSRGGQVIIRMRGLPFDCSAKQVVEFFSSGEDPCHVLHRESGVLFVKKTDGKATGGAFVLFKDKKDGKKAFQKHKQLIGLRYVEVFKTTKSEVKEVINQYAEDSVTELDSSLDHAAGGTSDQVQDWMIEDCYFYQLEKCTKESQCHYLHRPLPTIVCRKFMFGQCKKSSRCSKQHLDRSNLPPPPEKELNRLADKLGMEELPQFGFKRKVLDNTSASTGAVRKLGVGVVRDANWDCGNPVPEKSVIIKCLDCWVTATSCLLLENHLNTEEHWDTVKQKKIEGKELSGVVGDKGDTWCEVCSVRVEVERMEEHIELLSHMCMLEKCLHQDLLDIRDKENTQVEQTFANTHVSNIPGNISEDRFRLICLQFGEVVKLKMSPMKNSFNQHAYVRFSTEEEQEFAAFKLKELQMVKFARYSEAEESSGDSEIAKSQILHTDVMELLKDQTIERNKSSSYEFDSPTENVHNSLSNQLELLTLARKEEESRLIVCQNQTKFCQQGDSDIERSLRLLEEELSIQRKLRDLEIEEQNVRNNLARYVIRSNTPGSNSALTQTGTFLHSANDCYKQSKAACPVYSSTLTYFLPDDVFHSDDDDEFNDADSTNESFLTGHQLEEYDSVNLISKNVEPAHNSTSRSQDLTAEFARLLDYPYENRLNLESVDTRAGDSLEGTVLDEHRSEVRRAKARRFLGSNS